MSIPSSKGRSASCTAHKHTLCAVSTGEHVACRIQSDTCDIVVLSQVHAADDELQLKQLADFAGVPRSNFRQLVGLNANSSAFCKKTSENCRENLPKHKGGWRWLPVTPWLERREWKGLRPIPPFPLCGTRGDALFVYCDGIYFDDNKLRADHLIKLAYTSTVRGTHG